MSKIAKWNKWSNWNVLILSNWNTLFVNKLKVVSVTHIGVDKYAVNVKVYVAIITKILRMWMRYCII